MISLQMVDAEFVGDGADWPIVMAQLVEKNLVSYEHYLDACILWEFGFLINNTDMHLGNLSVGICGNRFTVLPCYDMCSMGFAPQGGEVRQFSFSPKSHSSRLDCLNHNDEARQKAHSMATDFWDRVAGDNRISDEFREFLSNGNPVH